MPDLHDVAELAAANGHLAVISTIRANGTVQASLVNAGVSTHPKTGRKVLALVTGGRVKLVNYAAAPRPQ